MPVKPARGLLVLLLASASASPLSGSGRDAWTGIEFDMRNAGCFKPPVATVRDALGSKDEMCRFRAVRVIGLKGEREATPELKALQESDPSPIVRNQAAVELVRLGERSYLDTVRQILEGTTDPVSRVSLAGQLADVGDPSGFRHVEDACRAAEVELRRACVGVLVFFKEEEMTGKVAHQYLDLADDPVEDVRRSAVYGLANLGLRGSLPREVVVRLESLAAGSPDLKVKEIAGMAVEEQKRKKRDSIEKQR